MLLVVLRLLKGLASVGQVSSRSSLFSDKLLSPVRKLLKFLLVAGNLGGKIFDFLKDLGLFT